MSKCQAIHAITHIERVDDADGGEDGEHDFPARQHKTIAAGPQGAEINGVRYTPVELCNLEAGTYNVIELPTTVVPGYGVVWNCEVTANILDGISIEPGMEVVVEIGTDDRELIFGNICEYGW